jgi:hypothetical protein
MRLLNAPPNVSCDPYTNVFDCLGSDVTFYGILICFITAVFTALLFFYVTIYRWRHGAEMILFHRVDGYWLPANLEAITMICFISNFVRSFHHACLLLDWPTNWISRSAIGGLLLWSAHIQMVIGMMSLVSFIPSSFGKRSSKGRYRERIYIFECGFRLYTPPAFILVWTTVALSLFQFIEVFATTI